MTVLLLLMLKGRLLSSKMPWDLKSAAMHVTLFANPGGRMIRRWVSGLIDVIKYDELLRVSSQSTPALHRTLYCWLPQSGDVLSGYGTRMCPQSGQCLTVAAVRPAQHKIAIVRIKREAALFSICSVCEEGNA